ncbi:hypothetical protein D3C87_1659790 [compost metagenome]
MLRGEVLARVLETCGCRAIHRAPAIRRVLLPFAVLASIDVAIMPGVDVAALAARDEPPVARRVVPVQARCIPRRAAADARELTAVLDSRRAPRPVDVCAATRGNGVACPWIVGCDEAA